MHMNSKQFIDNAMRTSSMASMLNTQDGVNRVIYNAMLIDVGLGLAGEAGEVADLIKKTHSQGHELNHNKLLDEASDICWYLAELAFIEGWTFEDLWEHNTAKLKKRYPEGFSVEKSVNRNG